MNKPKVFLCHATEDKAFVRGLYNRLTSDGTSPWLDEEDLLPGQAWEIEIENAIRTTDIFLACISRKSLDKRGHVQRELRIALEVLDRIPLNSIYLISARLEDCQLPFQLRTRQWVDFFPSFDTGYQKLLRTFDAYFWSKDVDLAGLAVTVAAARSAVKPPKPKAALSASRAVQISQVAHSLWMDFLESRNLASSNSVLSAKRSVISHWATAFARFVADIFVANDANAVDFSIVGANLLKYERQSLTLIGAVRRSGFTQVIILLDFDQLRVVDSIEQSNELITAQLLKEVGHIVLHWNALQLSRDELHYNVDAWLEAEEQWFASQIAAYAKALPAT